MNTFDPLGRAPDQRQTVARGQRTADTNSDVPGSDLKKVKRGLKRVWRVGAFPLRLHFWCRYWCRDP
jgi:hypothetical protein